MGFNGYSYDALIAEADRLEGQLERREKREGRDEVYWSLMDKLEHINEEIAFREGEADILADSEDQQYTDREPYDD